MKKLISALLSLLLILSLAACDRQGNGSGNIEGAMDEILSKVTDGVTDPEMALTTTTADNDSFSWFFFIDPIEGAEAVVSEASISSIPHSIGLIRLPDSADPQQVKEDITEKLDPRKWICVEAEKTAVEVKGNLILVAMSSKEAVDKAVENFQSL